MCSYSLGHYMAVHDEQLSKSKLEEFVAEGFLEHA